MLSPKFGMDDTESTFYRSANFLGDVLHQFDNDVATKILGGGDNFTLITDGQLHLRQCLFPEAQRKGLLPLPSYYYSFHDLRKEFAAAHTNSTAATVQEILNCESDYFLSISATLPIFSMPFLGKRFEFKAS